ncbi:hypothetical protein Anas_03092 [Armadillidium nasatum]|uniref:Amino acid transporter transmembrane domain-containing protein n=1 Tax=Armadillidium nasatum TaxID=96803 RepID=A0A5N5T278_9CRUS|nr:hypothetical protein Anas_03092 [Armadillidium nasatum]
MGNSGEKLDAKEEEQMERKAGLGYWLTSFFLVAQMAGAGFLAIPKAVSHASWGGAVMIILFCVSVGFSGMRLGRCWVILEERWEDYKKPSRQPYQEIAFRALGIHGRLPTLTSFSLGFGTILFSFGGASVFPTIQNDMKNRSDFWKSVILSFAVILLLYFPVGVLAFVLIGDNLNDNVLLSVGPSVIVTIAIALQIINLAGTYIITLNPVVQTVEDIIGVPTKPSQHGKGYIYGRY